MSNKSRRRVKLAAGAILAGAAIPIAAAGTAWADDDSSTAPGPVAAAGAAVPNAPVTPITETATQLEAQGLTPTEAQAVVNAENGTTPVEVSYDGKIVVEANEGGTRGTDATAKSGGHDVSTAIGGGTTSSAHGAGANSFAEGINTDDNSDRSIAAGTNASAQVEDATGSTAHATGHGSEAGILGGQGVDPTTSEVTDSSAVSHNGGFAQVFNDGLGPTGLTVEGDKAHSTGLGADGTQSIAFVYDSESSSATASHTGSNASGEIGAATDLAIDSKTDASHLGSGAIVEGTAMTAVSDSSETTTDGNVYTVITSDTHEVNMNGPTPMDAAAIHVPLLP